LRQTGEIAGQLLFFNHYLPTPFLRSFRAVDTEYYDQFEMDTLLRQCRFASPLMSLTRPGIG
jgi:hypothetical protein